MTPVLMKTSTDCEVAVIATATEKTYEQARKALSWRDLWSWLENPVFGNPWNLYRALIYLGFWKRNIVLQDLLSGEAEPMKTVVLVHDPKDPLFSQHWVVWGGITDAGNHQLLWGDDIKPRLKSAQQLTDLFRKGFPNCAFQVYKANVFKLWLEKIRLFFAMCYEKFKSGFK